MLASMAKPLTPVSRTPSRSRSRDRPSMHSTPSKSEVSNPSTSSLSSSVNQPEHPSDIPRLRQIHATHGYREGVALARAGAVQQGFDEGYLLGAAIGEQAGLLLGVVEGLVRAEPLLGHSVTGEHLSDQAESESEACRERVQAGSSDDTRSSKYNVGQANTLPTPDDGNLCEIWTSIRADLTAARLFSPDYFASDGTWTWTTDPEDQHAASRTGTMPAGAGQTTSEQTTSQETISIQTEAPAQSTQLEFAQARSRTGSVQGGSDAESTQAGPQTRSVQGGSDAESTPSTTTLASGAKFNPTPHPARAKTRTTDVDGSNIKTNNLEVGCEGSESENNLSIRHIAACHPLIQHWRIRVEGLLQRVGMRCDSSSWSSD